MKKKEQALQLSIIIPCYNEEKNIPVFVERVAKHKPKDLNFELRLVDNGSKDNTQKVIKSAMKKHDFISLTVVKQNQGYGWGLICGIKEAKSDYISWTHADNQADVLDAFKAYAILQKSELPMTTFVKGERYGRSLMDRFFSFGNEIVASIILGTYVHDLNAQPNLFHKSLLKNMSPPKDWGIELYCYYLAKKRKYTIKRLPVYFGERKFGASNWNTGAIAKLRYIKRAIVYTVKLKMELK